jgi:hypothetical protein
VTTSGSDPDPGWEDRVIEEADIRRFAPDRQEQIRADIALRIRNGYPRKYLRLSPKGTIVYDRYAAGLDIDLGLFDEKG